MKQALLQLGRQVRDLIDPPEPMPEGIQVVTLDGVRVALDFDQHTHRMVYRRRGFEPELTAALASAVRDGDVVLDIGTNFGWHSLHLARRDAVRRVYAFEPSARTLALFRRSVEANDLGETIEARRLALGREVGEATLKTFSALDSAHASIYPLADLDFEEESVPVAPLDALICDLVAPPMLVKCDVEGSEMDVLRGAEALLAGRFGPPPIWFLEANYETSGMAGYFPWQLIETAREHADYAGYTLREGRVVAMPHPRALRHGDTLILATPEAYAERFG